MLVKVKFISELLSDEIGNGILRDSLCSCKLTVANFKYSNRFWELMPLLSFLFQPEVFALLPCHD